MIFLTRKGIFICILAGIFIRYFGYPSYVKYEKHGTVFTETREEFDPQKTVGIAILVWRENLFIGWKNAGNWETETSLHNFCNQSASFLEVVQCINNGTFKHEEIIENYAENENDSGSLKQTHMTKDTRYTVDGAISSKLYHTPKMGDILIFCSYCVKNVFKNSLGGQ